MTKSTFLIAIAVFVLSCGQKQQTQETQVPSENEAADTIAMLNDPKNKLNIQTNAFSEIDSSGILMFPLSMGETAEDKTRSSYKDIPYGNFWNIIFYNSHTSGYHLLTDRKILISSFEDQYGEDGHPAVHLEKKHLFYRGVVDDHNNDRMLNAEDPEYLFVSDRQGNNFRLISPPDFISHPGASLNLPIR
jgi:hypothetical protein